MVIALSMQIALARVTINAERLMTGGGLYKESVKRSAIRCEAIRKLSLPEASAVMGFRINGIGMPGFRFGWFRPKEGRKIFALVGRAPVAWVPTTGHYDLLISVVATDRFVAELCGAAR